ncbi:MAG: hypothetical protein VB954_12375 [Thalassolituus sp.]|jgi:hypothetical protein|nr:hypothetical protein [Thalassolituus oleivorans]AHK17866.1 hypothetical protein R615_15575 [Thalassolituus oleivorans R6-15]MBQ0726775.1 hypothetical protein [Thalassolituus oleivorans]MBQ0781268.1 hypothetical protein [Thalassolituus oleivorans]MDF1641163.1 hypothetical protein [Thalassolituus oleivorans]|tara:strand:- start:233 stop:370 length:138 start_codon:yes stop_codon:yes gene_type:complete
MSFSDMIYSDDGFVVFAMATVPTMAISVGLLNSQLLVLIEPFQLG